LERAYDMEKTMQYDRLFNRMQALFRERKIKLRQPNKTNLLFNVVRLN